MDASWFGTCAEVLILVAIAIAMSMGLFVSLLGMVVALQPRRSKGAKGERMVANRLKDLNPEHYRAFHDLYLPRPDGSGSTQVDHVVISRFGIFVIETKYLNGWIFGSAGQKMWTQSIYGRSTQFQNPLHQNHLHVLALKGFLGLPERSFHSLVFFVDGDFRSEMPENVISSDLCGWIGQRAHVQLSEDTIQTVIDKLDQLEKSTDRKAAHIRHIRELKERKSMTLANESGLAEVIPISAEVESGPLPPPPPTSPWCGDRVSAVAAAKLSGDLENLRAKQETSPI